MSQNTNSSFPSSEVVIPAKAGIQRQRWISAFSGMTGPGGGRGQYGSGGESVWIPAFARMTRMKPGMTGVNSFPRWREFCDSL
ncbi:hypothetical protein [Endozoicomonas sp. 8E]|uniref:hypothetical protein n=1 Tax=Endozoicomonas sp. 8E TaxID=3035692 RepID=UPI002938E061|nr:hypothetical protein [Endozoicomonas sp. 8E]WOG26616.1 hypothetical protein P6910_19000 [Endozoicomonas sp. 8E]